jgi:hypothetical protein
VDLEFILTGPSDVMSAKSVHASTHPAYRWNYMWNYLVALCRSPPSGLSFNILKFFPSFRETSTFRAHTEHSANCEAVLFDTDEISVVDKAVRVASMPCQRHELAAGHGRRPGQLSRQSQRASVGRNCAFQTCNDEVDGNVRCDVDSALVYEVCEAAWNR